MNRLCRILPVWTDGMRTLARVRYEIRERRRAAAYYRDLQANNLTDSPQDVARYARQALMSDLLGIREGKPEWVAAQPTLLITFGNLFQKLVDMLTLPLWRKKYEVAQRKADEMDVVIRRLRAVNRDLSDKYVKIQEQARADAKAATASGDHGYVLTEDQIKSQIMNARATTQ